MRLLYLLLALLPLALTAASKERCECALTKCRSKNPAKCTCQNNAANACAKKCGGKPKTTKCPSPTTTTAPATPTPTLCGSRAMPPCADARQTCIADPSNLGCSLIADCAGLCVILDGQFCGGFAGFGCPAGQTCLDDPRDDCDTQSGGRDCGGVCVYLDGRSAANV